MENIVLIGGGGHCKSAIDVIEQEGSFKIIGIVDKSKSLGTNVLGYKVIGNDDELPKFAEKYKNAIITVGHIKSPSLRIDLFNLARKAGFTMPSIISPHAYVSQHARIGDGVIIMHNAIVNADSIIGDNSIINTKALIEHDCIISNHCHISTNAIINGGVKVESGSFVGSNATTRQLTTIHENSFIKAGSLVK